MSKCTNIKILIYYFYHPQALFPDLVQRTGAGDLAKPVVEEKMGLVSGERQPSLGSVVLYLYLIVIK